MQRHLGRAQVGRETAGTALNSHQRVRLLGARRQNAPRTVIFVGSADEMHAVGEQGRRERVAGVALVGIAVEGEAQRAAAVDPAARPDAKAGAHRPAFRRAPSDPALARRRDR